MKAFKVRKEKSRITLAADKRVAMVVMDTKDYLEKANNLLEQPVYRELTSHLPGKYKLINIIKELKRNTKDNSTYMHMYPTEASSPKLYGLPKIHKKDTTLQPIISSRDSVTYGVVKELAGILQLLVGKWPHHIQNSQKFIESRRGITLQPGECIASYDVTLLQFL